jgi:hypothetical protein
MKKIYLTLLAVVAGFVGAFITAGVHSLVFVLLPSMAFAFGYFSSWRRGLLYGFLLFASYTFSVSLIWHGIDSPNLFYPIPYMSAFIAGGFSLLIIGALAPMVKKGVRRFGSIAALVVLVIVVGWCGYSAIPHYGFYYQVAIQSSENLSNLELYLPVGAVSGEPYMELYDQVYKVPGELTEKYLTKDFAQELVNTEQGKMLKFTIPGLKKDDVPQPRYTANIIFWQKSAPRELLHLIPKSDVEQVNTVTWQRLTGPVKSHESLIVERFKVPVKIVSSTQGQIELTLWNRTDRVEAVNFTYSKSYSYTESISYDIQTGNEWVFIPVEATTVLDIRGISD